jgi:hypothetical protein
MMAMNESYDESTGREPESDFHGGQQQYESRQEQRFEQDPPPRRRRGEYKSAVAAAFLSMLPGAGQVYIGAYGRGLAHALTFAGIITILANGNLRGLEPLLGIFLAFFVIYNLVDAVRLAQAYNAAIDNGSLSAEPLKVDGNYGRGAGIALVVIGTFILLDTRFDMDMRWLEEWWPLAIILTGVWVIRNSMQRNESSGRG